MLLFLEPVEVEVGYYAWKFKIKDKNVSNWAVQIFRKLSILEI